VAIAGNCLLGSAKVGRIKCQIDVGITYTMYTLSHMCQQALVESEAQSFNIGTEGPPAAFTDHGQKFLTFGKVNKSKCWY